MFFGLPQYYLGMKYFIPLIMNTYNVNYVRVYKFHISLVPTPNILYKI